MAKKKHSPDTLYHYPLDDADTFIDPDLIDTVPVLALNPETWGRDRILRKARKMYKGKDTDDIRSYNPDTNAANKQLVKHYNFYKEKDRTEQLKKEGKLKPVKKDIGFGDLLAVHALNSGSMDNPHPTPYIVDPVTQAEVLKHGTKEDIANMFAVQNEFDRQQAAIKGSIAASALSTGLGVVTAGVIPTLTSTATGITGSYVGGKVGEALDEKFGTKWISPTLSFAGGLYGGYKGYQGSKPLSLSYLMKNPQQNGTLVTKEFATDAVADGFKHLIKNTKIDNSGLPANVGWAPAQTSTWYHHSNTPITEFKVPFKGRWDAVNHGADPNLIWLTKENGTAGMMAERPYHQQFSVILKKPMVQVGEVPVIPGQKNTSRNAIVKTSRDMGADAVIFDGIADNKLKGQQVVAVMGDRTTPTRIEDPKVLFSTGRGTLDVDFEDLPKNLHRFSPEDQKYINNRILNLQDKEFAKYKYENEFLKKKINVLWF